MPGAVDHVLLTRFNLRSPGVEDRISTQPGWLQDRVALFLRYCLPSVLAQDRAPTSWIIYFDRASPAWLRQAIEPHVARGTFRACYVDSVSTSRLISDLRAATGALQSHLMTTNLDNDDGLAVDFCRRLSAVTPQASAQAIYLVNGLIRTDTRLFATTDRSNAFCSVLEPWEGAGTCWADWHNLLPQRMPAVELEGPPGWLQVVHGTNVSNRAGGQLTSPRCVQHLVSGIEDLEPPSALAITADRLFLAPARSARSTVRRSARKLILRTIGKSGLERVKSALVRRS